MKLIVGLGNPEPCYLNTRHNIGFMAADRIAAETSATFGTQMFLSQCASASLHGHPVLVLKPQTHMNLSGKAVQQACAHYTVRSEDVIVIHDDMDIPFGRIKIKRRGGSAGHRGIASVIDHLKTDAFPRLRVGIGKPPDRVNPVDYVLQAFTHEEAGQLDELIGNVYRCIAVLLSQGPEAAMNMFHRAAHPAH